MLVTSLMFPWHVCLRHSTPPRPFGDLQSLSSVPRAFHPAMADAHGHYTAVGVSND
jgi:hypothetical protein